MDYQMLVHFISNNGNTKCVAVGALTYQILPLSSIAYETGCRIISEPSSHSAYHFCFKKKIPVAEKVEIQHWQPYQSFNLWQG
jgi:hypothetical protein